PIYSLPPSSLRPHLPSFPHDALPISYSSTYVEQAALARYLGLMLVEGDDLVMQDGRLHVRTVSGLKRADALWRRIDADFLDPLEIGRAHVTPVTSLSRMPSSA